MSFQVDGKEGLRVRMSEIQVRLGLGRNFSYITCASTVAKFKSGEFRHWTVGV